jgi:hypothetical protein
MNLQKIAEIYHRLYLQFSAQYSDTEIFKIFQRVYNEHFCVIADNIVFRISKGLTSSSLQSPDDIDSNQCYLPSPCSLE